MGSSRKLSQQRKPAEAEQFCSSLLALETYNLAHTPVIWKKKRMQACRNGQGAEANVQQLHKGNQISLKLRTLFLWMINRLQSKLRGKESVRR